MAVSSCTNCALSPSPSSRARAEVARVVREPVIRVFLSSSAKRRPPRRADRRGATRARRCRGSPGPPRVGGRLRLRRAPRLRRGRAAHLRGGASRWLRAAGALAPAAAGAAGPQRSIAVPNRSAASAPSPPEAPERLAARGERVAGEGRGRLRLGEGDQRVGDGERLLVLARGEQAHARGEQIGGRPGSKNGLRPRERVKRRQGLVLDLLRLRRRRRPAPRR